MSQVRQRRPQDKDKLDGTESTNTTTQAPEVKKTPMEIAQEKYRKFFTRSIWGAVMIGGFALILYTDHLFLCLFVMILQVIVFKEMISLRYTEAKEKNLWGYRSFHYYLLFITFFWIYGGSALQLCKQLFSESTMEMLYRWQIPTTFALYVIGFIWFIVTLKKGLYKYQFGQLTWTIMTLLVVVGQSGFIIQNIWKGLFWFLLPCSLIIVNDIMAYICGLLMGRRFVDRPLTSLSPNKTWEGFIGALFSTLVFAFFFSKFLSQFEWFICPKEIALDQLFQTPACTPSPTFQPHSYPLPTVIVNVLQYLSDSPPTSISLLPAQLHGLVFALFASLIAPFGGFFASGIKRAYKIKDFDSLFPGHGGMTDRMDCQFIMGFFAYVYIITFINYSTMNFNQILFHIGQLPRQEQLKLLEQLNNTLYP